MGILHITNSFMLTVVFLEKDGKVDLSRLARYAAMKGLQDMLVATRI